MDNKLSTMKSTREIIGPIFWIKIIGIGDVNVGKTCIIRCFCDKKFAKNYLATVGADYGFKIHEREGIEYRLNFWDFGGDSEYDLIRKDLYKETQGCMLVYDVSNRTSFDNLETWLTEFQENCNQDAIIVVVGNKSDKAVRQVSNDEGAIWAKEHGFSFFETSTSSKTGIKELLNNLVKEIIERRLIKPKWIGNENKPTSVTS